MLYLFFLAPFSIYVRQALSISLYICMQIYGIMLKVFLLSLAIIGLSMLFLCVRILLKKNGRFPKTHVSSSRAMRERGVGCAQSQDFMARIPNPHAVKEVK